ncbi:MAG TPA: TIGR02234 family membrane protein [Mycobacterium sp.]|nr:TIGR02234 family membrane protein [Mycobacterium sp.]
MIRFAPLLLVLSAAALWGASRMVWVDVQSFDGLGQPKTTALTGGTWSTALVPLAAILLVAAVAPIAVRGWRLGVLAVVIAGMSAVMGYLAISLWVIRDVAVRAVHLAGVPAADLVGTQRHYGGAILTLVAAVGTLVGAVMLLRSVAKPRPEVDRYERRRSAQSPQDDADTSERVIWDALDEGLDPTDPDNKGR